MPYHVFQEFLHEEPYTAEEIKKIVDESLPSVLEHSPTSLAILAAAKHFKLFQVVSLFLLQHRKLRIIVM